MNVSLQNILNGVLHAVASSVDFLPHEGEPSVWDTAIPSFNIVSYEELTRAASNDGGMSADFLKITLEWKATLMYPGDTSRIVRATYLFEDDQFEERFGVHGLIMNFHDHVVRELNLSIKLKE
ncbi:hypothetical protein [Burkholderia phage BCSR5]|nr:hypothetical protein [Burkholderia phage BCSR5]